MAAVDFHLALLAGVPFNRLDGDAVVVALVKHGLKLGRDGFEALVRMMAMISFMGAGLLLCCEEC